MPILTHLFSLTFFALSLISILKTIEVTVSCPLLHQPTQIIHHYTNRATETPFFFLSVVMEMIRYHPSFASMASNPNSRSLILRLRSIDCTTFNGLVLDWEYPNDAMGMSNFGTLLQEWRSAVAAEANRNGSPPLLLTAVVFYSDHYSAILPGFVLWLTNF
ncbi:unnamed protein product [Arabidopsis halleri]